MEIVSTESFLMFWAGLILGLLIGIFSEKSKNKNK